VKKAKKRPNFLIIILAILAIGIAVYVFYFRNQDSTPEGPVVISYAIKDPFVTNVKESQKLFKTTVVLGINDKKLTEYLDENLHIIRDTILFIVRSLSEEDILRQGIQEELRVTVSKALNEALQIDGIVTIYFSDFVMQ